MNKNLSLYFEYIVLFLLCRSWARVASDKKVINLQPFQPKFKESLYSVQRRKHKVFSVCVLLPLLSSVWACYCFCVLALLALIWLYVHCIMCGN